MNTDTTYSSTDLGDSKVRQLDSGIYTAMMTVDELFEHLSSMRKKYNTETSE